MHQNRIFVALIISSVIMDILSKPLHPFSIQPQHLYDNNLIEDLKIGVWKIVELFPQDVIYQPKPKPHTDSQAP